MQNRKLDNQTLDAIGKKLIVSDARRVADVDALLSNPRLFAAVRARIAVVETPEVCVSWFALTRFNVAAFSAAAAVLLLVVGAFSLLDKAREPVAVNTIQILPQVADVARPVFPPQGIVSKFSSGRANKDDFKIEKARLKQTVSTLQPVLEDIRHGPKFHRPLGRERVGGGTGPASTAAHEGNLDGVVLGAITGARRGQRGGKRRSGDGTAGSFQEFAA